MDKKLVAWDVECSTINNGDPYHPDNRLVQVGFYDGKNYTIMYKEKIDIESIEKLLNQSYIVGANLKFDLAWMERIGIDTRKLKIYDIQIAEFLITNQTKAFPSLNDMAEKYLDQHKIDQIKAQYWDNGIDTWFIPEDELTAYLREDLRLTLEVFKQQEVILKEHGKWNLFKLQCLDLVVLNNMEWNGLPYDREQSLKNAQDLEKDIAEITANFSRYTNCPSFNPASGDHLSCLLYGGTITHEYRVPIGIYKTGIKAGQPRNKVFKEEYPQEQLVEPIRGSELKKEGYWSVDEQTLSSLKPKTKEVKQLISDILILSKLEKLKGTYYEGLPKIMDERGWENNLLHGKFNQCVARTGRLSSSQPNLQNFPPEALSLCRSEYD